MSAASLIFRFLALSPYEASLSAAFQSIVWPVMAMCSASSNLSVFFAQFNGQKSKTTTLLRYPVRPSYESLPSVFSNGMRGLPVSVPQLSGLAERQICPFASLYLRTLSCLLLALTPPHLLRRRWAEKGGSSPSWATGQVNVYIAQPHRDIGVWTSKQLCYARPQL
ncbi:unnamed protein product [Protopolystoma xenopodis]|uniref:Uncharacterized protein n=1 Tax=Protopolystoma xenopodis TaxID=117903 RepID=A0A3S5FGH0_9PLAT|nr:unnamed protein product [Protopolystoma xenopodis]